jgi:amino-acid N-acetyltransferase
MEPAASTAPVLEVPAAERAFYVDEFAGATIVVSLSTVGPEVLVAVERAASSLRSGGSRLVAVAGSDAGEVARRLGSTAVVLDAPVGPPPATWIAELWIHLADRSQVVVAVRPGAEAATAARLGAAVGARKVVLTDPGGGWGRPPRSFADIATHADALRTQLADRQGGAIVAALTEALAGGVENVNLCRPADLDRELFTFDGSGTLFTSGGYVALDDLGVDDLDAVERLVAQGVADGLLRPRPRTEVARLAISGLGARVLGSGHLAGIVSLETEPYVAEQAGEIASLYTVSRFSGAGAGALLVDGALERARELGLRSVFAVTVSDAAAAFFERRGFAEVAHEDVPPAKWVGYDAARREVARAFARSPLGSDEQPSFGF